MAFFYKKCIGTANSIKNVLNRIKLTKNLEPFQI